jgi:hypothetical protein
MRLAGEDDGCGALWPAPPCGWLGTCVNGTCVCDAGWELNLFVVDGVVLCTRLPGLDSAMYTIAGYAFSAAVALMWAVELREARTRGAAHVLRARRTQLAMAVLLPVGSVLFFIAAGDHEIMVDRTMTASFWLIVWLYDTIVSVELLRFVRVLAALAGRDPQAAWSSGAEADVVPPVSSRSFHRSACTSDWPIIRGLSPSRCACRCSILRDSGGSSC